MNKNCLSYWFPKIRDCGVLVPRTEFLRTDVELIMLADGITPDGYGEFIEQLKNLSMTFSEPFFLRSGQTSAKHDWENSCLVRDRNKIERHVYQIFEFGECASLIGLDYDVWVIRELIKTRPAFYAFYGNMPIVKERRYFISGGKVIGKFNYWPDEAISGHCKDSDWKQKLIDINIQSDEEIKHLTEQSILVSNAIDGEWSVDWLQDSDGKWWLTDMAVAKDSYYYDKL